MPIRVLFICHGNICRSTMAESMMTDIINKKGLQAEFQIDSAAVSYEETGNGVHPGTVRKLREVGIPIKPHRAVRMEKEDYPKYDYIIGMDTDNIRRINRIIGDDPDHKVYLMMDFAGVHRDVKDPWYTGNFDETYEDLCIGLKGLCEHLGIE